MKIFLTFSILFLAVSLNSCGGGGVGTCTCTCVIDGAGTDVNNLAGDYTEDECDSAASLVEDGGTNECGNFSDGSVVCTSSWAG